MGGKSARRLGIALAVLLGAGVLLATASPALGANAYGLTYVGQAGCIACHGGTEGRWQVGTYTGTAHGLNVVDVEASPTALVPGATTSYWPSPINGAGTFRFAPADVKWMIGSPFVDQKRFISKYRNVAGTTTLSTGSTVTKAAGPTDDWMYFNSAQFYTDDNRWGANAVTIRAFFASCGPCHFTGVTRPAKQTYTLANGSTITSSTETSFAVAGIGCEMCHATGDAAATEAGGHWSSGVKVTRTLPALRSQTCGQCHGVGVAKELPYTGTSWSNPNGFTPDDTLTAYMTFQGNNYLRYSLFQPEPEIPSTDATFYPNGSWKRGGHGDAIYNEWRLSAHGHSLRNVNGGLYIPFLTDECLPCHSGEGFLKSIGYGQEGPNDTYLHTSSVANDTLNVECSCCHTVHSKAGDALGLRIEGSALCVKCHTGQFVKGSTKMVGVPAAGAYMATVPCYGCHMPRPNGSASHSFKIITPEEAEDWDTDDLGDSCTPCHSTYTAEELQDVINEATQSVSAALAAAEAARDGAMSRTASSTVAGKALIAAADNNIEVIDGDGSGGFHNPGYAIAGLNKAVFFAKSVGARYSRFGVTAFDPATGLSMVYGTLKYGDGTAVSGGRVTVEALPAGTTTWRVLKTVTTQSDGDFYLAVAPSVTTRYRAKWTPLYSSTRLTSVSRTLTMPTVTTIAVSKSSMALGNAVRVSGKVAPSHAGQNVVIRYRVNGGAWNWLVAKKLDPASYYYVDWKPWARGFYEFKTSFAGDATHAPSVSSVVSVRVY